MREEAHETIIKHSSSEEGIDVSNCETVVMSVQVNVTSVLPCLKTQTYMFLAPWVIWMSALMLLMNPANGGAKPIISATTALQLVANLGE